MPATNQPELDTDNLTESTDKHDVAWKKHADDVIEFRAANGRWPFRIALEQSEVKLGHWLSRNRAQARDCKFKHLLTPERLAYMDGAGSGWRSSYDERWFLVADSLGRFRAERGRWPSAMATSSFERRLGQWLGDVRTSANTPDRPHGHGYARFFSAERREHISRVAPGWMSNLRRDERGFAMLADDLGSFRLTYQRWPRQSATDPNEARLARWLSLQRKHATGGPGSRRLTWGRRRHLNLAAPGWRRDDGITQSWVAKADDIGDFHWMYGRLPRGRSTNPAEVVLGQWLAGQRAQARSGSDLMTRARRTYLNDAAPGWAPAPGAMAMAA